MMKKTLQRSGAFGTAIPVVITIMTSMAWLLNMRLSHINRVLYMPHTFRQADTGHMIENYYRFGINLFKPMVGWLGRDAVYALEFPLPAAVIAALYHLFGPDVAVAKIVFLLGFLVGAGYLYRLMKHLCGSLEALITLWVYMLLPVSVFYSVALQIDYMVVSACLGFLYHAARYFETARLRKHLVAAGLWFAFAVLEKPPFILCALPMILVWLWLHLQSRQGWAFIIACLPGALLCLGWVVYSQILIAPTSQMGFLTNDPVPGTHGIDHLLGTWPQRFVWLTWQNLGSRLVFEDYSFLPAATGMAGLLIAATAPRLKAHRFWLLYLLGCLVMVLVFFDLQISHNYYQLPFSPLVAALAGLALAPLFRQTKWVAVAVVVSFTAISSIGVADTFFKQDIHKKEVGKIVETHTQPNEVVIFCDYHNGTTDPSYPFMAHRLGYNVQTEYLTSARLEAMHARGANVMVVINGQDQLIGSNLRNLVGNANRFYTNGNNTVDIYYLRP